VDRVHTVETACAHFPLEMGDVVGARHQKDDDDYHHHCRPLLSVCIACVRSWALAVVRGCWLLFEGAGCCSWVLARRSSLQLVTWHGHVVVVVSVCRGGWVVKQGGGGCWLQPRRCNDMHLLFV